MSRATSEKLYVDFNRYSDLRSEKQDLVRHYYCEAKAELDCEEYFRSFIAAWIAFNAIATCITDSDRDDKVIKTLSQDPDLSNDFKKLLEDNINFSRHANAFRRTWLIPNVQRIRQFERVLNKSLDGKSLAKTDKETLSLWGLNVQDNVIYDSSITDRQFHIVQNDPEFLIKGKDIFSPECWIDYRGRLDEIECNWKNSLQAIYRVRCNIFHSDKSPLLSRNQEIVSTSLQVLLNTTEYFLLKAGVAD
jgi:hypothetical protein